MRLRKTCIVLALIIAFAAIPRCWNVWRQGVEDYDGANLTLEAQLIVNVLDGFWHKAIHRPYALPQLIQLRGRPPAYAKPLYTVSLVPGWLLRIPRTDIASIFGVFWAVVTIPILYLIGRDLWGPREGLFAAAAYGASGFAAFYARMAAAESFGFFCLAIALWQYVRLYEGPRIKEVASREQGAGGQAAGQQTTASVDSTGPEIGFRRRIVFPLFVGFLWALAILANYRLLLTAAAVLTVCELLAAVRRGPRNLIRSALIAAALFGTLVATELAFRFAVHAWRNIGGEFHAKTYWEQLRFFLFERRPVGNRFEVSLRTNLYDFAHYWWKAEGPLLPLFGAAGMIVAWMRPGRLLRTDGALAVAAVATAAVWSVQHFTVPRVMAVLAIFLALFAGWAASLLAKRLRLEKTAGVALLLALYCVVLTTMVVRIGPGWFSRKSGFRYLPQAVAAAGKAPLYAFWRQKPATALYVVDREINQIDEKPGDGDFSPSNMPDSGLLVAESDYVKEHYGDNAEILGQWPLRINGNALALSDGTWSWDAALEQSRADVPLVLARIRGKARDLPAK